MRARRRRIRPHHLRDTLLHRLAGDRLFEPRLWSFTRPGVAGGLALGTFVALTPALGVHMVLAGLGAYLLRVNLPVAVAACWISNPLTAPMIYPLQLELGRWLAADAPRLTDVDPSAFRTFIGLWRPLWYGSLLSGTVTAAAAYACVWLLWGPLSRRLPDVRLPHLRLRERLHVGSSSPPPIDGPPDSSL